MTSASGRFPGIAELRIERSFECGACRASIDVRRQALVARDDVGTVTVRDDRLTINGRPVPFTVTATYNDGCYIGMQVATERLGSHTHRALLCPVPLEVTSGPLPGCSRSDARGYVCRGSPPPGAEPLIEPRVSNMVVPAGEYLMIGDNRDNSDDGRFWGFVTERELIGKATFIAFNWDVDRTGGPVWGRIGTRIR